MANENLIKIGPIGDIQEISAIGRQFIVSESDGIRREDRSSSGLLEREILSRKKSFVLSYETADQEIVDRAAELSLVIGELTLEINHLDRATESFNVLLQPYSQDRLLAIWGGLWQGVKLEFTEV